MDAEVIYCWLVAVIIIIIVVVVVVVVGIVIIIIIIIGGGCDINYNSYYNWYLFAVIITVGWKEIVKQ